MPKDELKRQIGAQQGFSCALTGERIDPIATPELIDTDRVVERFKGGKYTDKNTRIVTPRAHMQRHGNLREREEWLADLKAMMDSRSQAMKLQMKINNQLLAYKRLTDEPNPDDEAFLAEQLGPVVERVKQVQRRVEKHIRASSDPLVQSAMGVVSMGAMTVAGLTVYIDLERANSASALWSYTGLHKPQGKRYEKGKAGGGNKTLRTIMWNSAVAMTKNRACPYREVYDRTKARLEVSENIVTSRNNQGREVQVAWKDTMASHRHGAALRAVMKHVLADYWMVGRTYAGLPTRSLYVDERLGHTGIIRPAERGWTLPT